MDCQEEYYLFYDCENNCFIDDFGAIIYHIFSIISPNTLRLFKLYKEDMLAWTIDGGRVCLCYPYLCDEEEMIQ
jgi:hypothetical protein